MNASSEKTAPSVPAPAFRRLGFTLIELLTAIAIIGILAAITMAAVGKVRASAHAAKCGSNLRQIASLALVWSQANRDWCPQAMWAMKDIHKSRAGATNLRSVGLTDELIKCAANENAAPNYAINNQLVAGGPDGQWGRNDVQYWERGRYKQQAVLSSRTVCFAEVKQSNHYMAITEWVAANHNGKIYVSYTDGHVGQRAPETLQTAAHWREGIQ